LIILILILIFSFGDYAVGNIQNIIQYLSERDPNRYGPPPASTKTIENLKEFIFGENDDNTNNNDDGKVLNDCAICKETFVKDEKLIILTCNHKYHTTCIIPWLKLHNTCPVCRYQLPADEDNNGESSSSSSSSSHSLPNNVNTNNELQPNNNNNNNNNTHNDNNNNI